MNYLEKLRSISAALKTIKWLVPNLKEETVELIRTTKDLGLNFKELLNAVKKGQFVVLTDALWARLENSDSWQIKNLEEVEKLAGEYQRDWQRIVEGMKTGAEIQAPIVLMSLDRIYLISGNTRLMVAKALGIQPKIWLITMNTNT